MFSCNFRKERSGSFYEITTDVGLNKEANYTFSDTARNDIFPPDSRGKRSGADPT